MKTMFFAVTVFALMVTPKVQAQSNAQDAWATGRVLIIEMSQTSRNKTSETEATKRNDRNARVQEREIDAQVEMNRESNRAAVEINRGSNNAAVTSNDRQAQVEEARIAADIYRTAAETGTSGSASARNGQVAVRVERNPNGPMVR